MSFPFHCCSFTPHRTEGYVIDEPSVSAPAAHQTHRLAHHGTATIFADLSPVVQEDDVTCGVASDPTNDPTGVRVS